MHIKGGIIMSKRTSSGGTNYSNVVRLAAFWALVLAAITELLSFIFRMVGLTISGFDLIGILSLIGNILLILALGLAAWDFTKGKHKAWRVILILAIVVLIVFRVLNFGHGTWF
jgi:phosphoglycerol transferase MdoB-like AlkP superfamily enzyme